MLEECILHQMTNKTILMSRIRHILRQFTRERAKNISGAWWGEEEDSSTIEATRWEFSDGSQRRIETHETSNAPHEFYIKGRNCRDKRQSSVWVVHLWWDNCRQYSLYNSWLNCLCLDCFNVRHLKRLQQFFHVLFTMKTMPLINSCLRMKNCKPFSMSSKKLPREFFRCIRIRR